MPVAAASKPLERPPKPVERTAETASGPESPSGPAVASPLAAVPDKAPDKAPERIAESAPPAEAPPAPKPGVRTTRRDDTANALRTLLARAREQRDRGRCEAALDLYGQALAVDGRNAAALAGRGACYLDLSRYAQAEASFEEALESDPRSAESLFGLAETCRYMGRKADAVAWYERFLAVRSTGDDAAAARRLISQLKE